MEKETEREIEREKNIERGEREINNKRGERGGRQRKRESYMYLC